MARPRATRLGPVGRVVVVVVGAGLIGRRLARRALEPVARASDAARSMAEGLLDTRLPVHGDDEFADWAASFNRMAEALVEATDLTALVVAVARSRGWSERLSLPTGSVTLDTDPRRLERIIANLIGNALAHGAPPVEVRAASEGGAAVLTVTDHGPGIRAEDLSHVFERFYKADVSRTESGSGLGLAIARENARLLGGDIEAASEPGRTRFTLRLPVTELLHHREDHVARRDEDAAEQPSTGGTA